jgi:dienelactone hydrolase
MTREVEIAAGQARLNATLTVPAPSSGIVLFAHGSGSSRFSRRNRAVAEHLNRSGFATLLLDLLTRREEEVDSVTGALRFDIPLLASRLEGATAWVAANDPTARLPVGYFGASTGAAAALIAASRQPSVSAVVSRGGRPDLAGEHLIHVRAATLLIVGGMDTEVLRLNRDAYALLTCEKQLQVVPGASHLFEEPGALALVATHASHWFARHLAGEHADTANRPSRNAAHEAPT